MRLKGGKGGAAFFLWKINVGPGKIILTRGCDSVVSAAHDCYIAISNLQRSRPVGFPFCSSKRHSRPIARPLAIIMTPYRKQYDALQQCPTYTCSTHAIAPGLDRRYFALYFTYWPRSLGRPVGLIRALLFVARWLPGSCWDRYTCLLCTAIRGHTMVATNLPCFL